MILGVRDRPIWNWDSKLIFSIKSVYYMLNDDGLWCLFAKVIWSIRAPFKVRAFLWLVINDVILTWDNLKKGDGMPGVCTLCTTDDESIDDLLLSYPLVLLFGIVWVLS